MNTSHGAITVKKGVVVNQQEFRQHLGAYILIMGGCAAKLLKKQARLFCDDMLDFTMPFAGGMGNDGRSSQARKVGTDVVESQIESIFLPLAYVKAGEILNYGHEGIFNAWLRARQSLPNPKLPDWLLKHPYSNEGLSAWTKFQNWKFAQDQASTAGGVDLSTYYTGNIKTIHEKSRGGNKNSGYFDNMDMQATMGDKFVVDDKGEKVAAYIKRVQARVGELKAGWFSAGSQIGKIKAGAWIRGNQWGTGIVNNKLDNPGMPWIEVGNRVQGLHRATINGYELAINYRAYSMRVEMYEKLVKLGRADQLFHLASHYSLGQGFDIKLP